MLVGNVICICPSSRVPPLCPLPFALSLSLSCPLLRSSSSSASLQKLCFVSWHAKLVTDASFLRRQFSRSFAGAAVWRMSRRPVTLQISNSNGNWSRHSRHKLGGTERSNSGVEWTRTRRNATDRRRSRVSTFPPPPCNYVSAVVTLITNANLPASPTCRESGRAHRQEIARLTTLLMLIRCRSCRRRCSTDNWKIRTNSKLCTRSLKLS